jgi:hypothetical protein
MKYQPGVILCALAVLLVSPRPGWADSLRGFGTLQMTRLSAGQGVRFECDSPAHAVLLIHKLARDMAESATVPSRWTSISIGGLAVPVLVRPGLGAYLVLARGNSAYCFTAPLAAGQGDESLPQGLAAAAPLVPGAQLYDAAYTYPAYLNKWSSAGIGTWYTPYDPFDDDPKGLKDNVTPHFQYMKDNGLTAHVSDFGPSRRETEHYIQEFQLPWHMARWLEWDTDIARLDPFDLIQPGPTFTGYSDYYGQISFGGDRLQQYRDWDFQKVVKRYVDDPLLVDWDEPHGEIGPAFYLFYNDYGAENRAHFVKWLQADRHYTLKSLGAAWHHEPRYFSSWSQVPIPWDYSLFGADKDTVFADHTWRLHTADVPSGIAAGYAHSQFDDSKWPSLQLPGGELGSLPMAAHKRLWYRGTFTVSAAYLAAHKRSLYLDVATLTEAGGPNNPDKIWLNGVDLGGLSGPGGQAIFGCKDVSGLAHPGINHIAYSPASDAIPGTFFLAARPMQPYPSSDSGVNARYVDWQEYIASCALEEETHTIKMIRGTDPNRPIKVMAAGPRDIFDPMLANYGGYLHNTGDEAFFGPWDRRLGYPYGLRASAESSGSMLDPVPFKRWLGWFTFEGLNAFDNFIDVEAMMYSKVTPLWKENFPYLHLANRYNLKKPEVGLLWSSENARLNTGGKGGLSYALDLGRGDLQSLGYSFAYFDEPGLRRGLAQGYKVLWDCGTAAMSRQTVDDIRHYVEAGGTFVALQETGRHTLTERDAWPIESLTGFKVQQIRPMGGFVSILDDQPLFSKLRGKTFLNEGRSIDYSGYNYADLCTVLEPMAPGTEAIARYRDGSIAIGLRRLGMGRVVVLGSPFWRDSYDQAGVWWPGPGQNEFVQDLLTGLGVPPDVPADTQKVWRDRYIANNGTEEYLVLFNPGDKDPQTFTTDWNASFPISQVFDPKTGEPVACPIDGSTAHLSLTLQPLETKILAVQSARPPTDSVADWYHDLAVTWKASLPGQTVAYPDVPRYYVDFQAGSGKVVATTTVTPERLARLSSSIDSEAGWDRRLDMIRPSYAGMATEAGQSVLYRRVATVPASWHPGDTYRLRVRRFERADFNGVAYLNGKLVATSRQVQDAGENGIDVGSAIRLGMPNILVIAADQNGFAGDPDLWRQPAVANRLSLAGPWTVQLDEDHGTGESILPGDFTGLFATKSVMVPQSWSHSHVFLRMEWDGAAPGSIAVNNKVMFFQGPAPRYMDVTPWIRFGQPNRILIQSQKSMQAWQPGKVTITSAELEQAAHL